MNRVTDNKTLKSSRVLFIMKVALVLFFMLVIGLASFFTLLEKNLDKAINLTKPYILTIDNGTTFQSLSKQFVKLNWIETRFWLRSYGRIYPNEVKIKAGTYKILANTRLTDLLTQVVSGKEHLFTITFIEGSTFKECLKVLAAEPRIQQTLSGKTVAQIASLLNIPHENPEGLLFPETYAFSNGTADIEVLKRANSQLEKELASLWKDRAAHLPYDTPYQALIMASIIEKETSVIAEQPIISSVFVNRLAKRMRLQTDPTIIYGLGDRYTGDITRANMREKTAYNTYRINGLPPTPISMAGYSAIKATLNPDTSDFIYFVSKGNGQHKFSKTLKEHNKAVRAFLALPR